ncbi:MAG: glycosyltransferase [Chloroflexi bacterium]|nr:glycosyltransferase [Chloroflexota bacterium]
MRVLHVYKDFFPVLGGIENHVRLLSREQVRRGLEVTVVVANPGGRTVVEDFDGVKVVKSGRLATVASTPLSVSLFAEVRKHKADITHLHFPYPLGELAYLIGKPSPRMIITYHSDIVRQKNLLRFYAPFLQRVLSRADAIIATSPNYVSSSPYLSRFADKCAVIPFGVDLSWLDRPDETKVASIRQRYGSPIVFFVGRFRYYKGLHYLIEAMKSVSATLLLCGSGPQEPELRDQVEREGLEGKVAFLGEVGDAELPNYYHAGDIFAFPACERSEAFGISMVEAMACGLPAVCTELGTGTTFVNQHGVTGLVVPPRDPRALAEALGRLAADETLRRRLATAARERARQEFSQEVMVDRILGLYRRLLAA